MNKSIFIELWEQFKQFADGQVRAIKEADSWDGSASRWDTPEAYCKSCLIDVSGDEKSKDRCFLPVRDPGESAYNSQAIKAAAGGRGISRVKKPADVPQDEWDSAVKSAASKIASAYKEMEMEVPPSVEKLRATSMHMLEEMAYRAAYEKYPMAGIGGLYCNDDGSMFMVLSQNMKLYRSEVEMIDGELVLSDWQEVTQEFVPRSQTTITRQADGKVRWLSISATATINKDGEIDSRQLFDNFVRRAEETGQYPERIFYHQRGQKYVTGQTDYLARVGNCYISGGVYNDTPLAQSEIKAREANPTYWGDSIGYLPMGEIEFIKVRGFDIPVYQDGINVEISTLPTKEASSLFIQTEVKRAMNEKQLKALADLHFEGDVERAKKWIEENPDEVNRQIENRGLVTRATGEGEQPEFELTDEAIQIIVTRTLQNEVIQAQQGLLSEQTTKLNELTEKLTSVETALAQFEQRLKGVETTDQEKRQRMAEDLPTNAVITRLTYRPSEQRGTEQINGKTLAEKTLDDIGLTY